MRLIASLALIALSVVGAVFGQGGSRLAADAPVLSYKEVPEWPALIANAVWSENPNRQIYNSFGSQTGWRRWDVPPAARDVNLAC